MKHEGKEEVEFCVGMIHYSGNPVYVFFRNMMIKER